ncbi:MAG TPA: LptF/LptG family permease, partial [Candidatus Aquicultoraceae bacterium]|nr:LptF/LptG family permease [Candidatus Aquicultoraceae bacterium]
DSEITALSSAGMGMRGLLPPVLLLSVATFLANLGIGWAGLPWGERILSGTIARIVSVRAGAGVEERVFQEVAPDVLLFPDRVSSDGTAMEGVMLSQVLEGQDPLLVFAQEGRFLPAEGDGPAALVLQDGTIHQEDRGEEAYRLASFREMEFRLAREHAEPGDRGSPRVLTLPELARRISEPGAGRDPATYRYHFHRRLSLAASCIAFGLLAIPLGHSQRARGKSPAIALTLVVILVYYVFLAAAGVLEDVSSPLMTVFLWLPNAAGLGAACWFLWCSENRLFVLPHALYRLAGKP